ncbi:CCA tRNA nucleotidyltransferase [Evansella sp. LMS18]|jgi:tRNA nucleotidyltransferase (CCA-adding enzyme)|uniref:CCA tRNA nucleotidyltransferase n=1 Tax=Evansella sp. LMS18 TaxID=2924033 RepID=UPI0020D139AF|nr:CCA tRNA nucleotidyltransferase [Evansella sp. LMS18]UTR09651.1 CCA tRNA nucleotidyltransferase [Evansella sp. LMS18]
MVSWDEAARQVLAELRKEGYEAYIVGGAVRDKVMGKPVRDIDICTDAAADAVKNIFPRTAEPGANHGTILVSAGGKAIEVSEFRGHPDGGLTEDLSVRDFTCNAMAMTEEGRIIDPFHGQADIRRKLLQSVGDPAERFTEDPLRLLRALRLSLQLGFKVDTGTNEAMEKLAPLIRQCAVERIAAEFEKAAKNELDINGLSFLLSHPVVKELPYLGHACIRLSEKAGAYEGNGFSIQTPVEWWSIIAGFRPPDEARSLLQEYKRSGKIIKSVMTVLEETARLPGKQWDDLTLYRLGPELIPVAEKLLALREVREPDIPCLISRFRELPLHSKKDLMLNGNLLMREFPQKPGKWIGKALNSAEEAVILGKVGNDTERILEWLKREKWV